MKKLPVLASLTFFFTFLGIFIYSYKSSGKFRQSIASALLAALVLFSWPLESQAKDVDAFTQQTQQHQSRPQHDRGIFGRKSKNDGSGPGKPNGSDGDDDDGGKLQYTAPESVQDTNERVERIHQYVRELEEETDSESGIETESECESAEQLQKEVSDSDTENEEDQCRPESKAGFKELPDGKSFLYDMEQGRGLKNQAKKVWKNPKAKQEVLRMLNRFDDENANIQEKPLKGFKTLTELKNSGPGPRIIVYRGKNEPPRVIVFCMRNNLDPTLAKLKGKYN